MNPRRQGEGRRKKEERCDAEGAAVQALVTTLGDEIAQCVHLSSHSQTFVEDDKAQRWHR